MDADWDVSEVFALPGGVVLADGEVLTTAALRPLDGQVEDWLATFRRTPNAVAVTRVLGHCLVRLGDRAPTRELIRQILVGDRDYLMLQLRRLTLGDHLAAVLACPGCRVKFDVDFSLVNVTVDRRPQDHLFYAMELAGRDGPSRTVRFRLPNGGDQEVVAALDPADAVKALLERCLDPGEAPADEGAWEVVASAMEGRAPRVEVELELVCPDCGHAFVEPFDLTGFFLDEIRRGSSQLRREVHTLAFYYHWSEADILELTRTRRREYLSLIADSLRAD
jgi:hypothetical protein